MLPEPIHRLGVLFRNDAEVVALRALGTALEAIVDDLGDVPAEQYLADPRWSQVVRLAATAHKLLTAPDRDI